MVDGLSDEMVFILGLGFISIATFWVGVGFYAFAYRRGWWAAYRIQPGKAPSDKLIKKAVWRALFNQFVLTLPLLWLTYPAFAYFGLQFTAPGWEMLWQVPFCLLAEDSAFYLVHRTLHSPKLFKKIHSLHHEFVTPRPIAAIYAHPLEFIIGNSTPVILGPLLLCAAGFDVHFLTVAVWLFIRMLETLDAHSGFDLPVWFPHKLIYGGGARLHDLHHSRFNGNYATFFHHWDLWLGTMLKEKSR